MTRKLKTGLFGIGLEAYWPQFKGLKSRQSVALDRLAEARQLGSTAYYYEGAGNNENANVISSIILGTVGVGHVWDRLDKLGKLLGVEVTRICSGGTFN